jgi:hypothetical protein
MKNSPTPKQLINAELAARSLNTKAKNLLKKHTPKTEQDGLMIEFYCECSDENCQERVALTLDQYEKFHQDKALFVLAKGHEEPKVEAAVTKQPDFTIVEKYAL